MFNFIVERIDSDWFKEVLIRRNFLKLAPYIELYVPKEEIIRFMTKYCRENTLTVIQIFMDKGIIEALYKDKR
jgi:hypothetical protein